MPTLAAEPYAHIETWDTDLPQSENLPTFFVKVCYRQKVARIELQGAGQQFGQEQEVAICRQALEELAEALAAVAASPERLSWQPRR